MQASKIPKTGKIGNLAKNIEKETDISVVIEVMQEIDRFKSASDRAEKAEWIKGAIEHGLLLSWWFTLVSTSFIVCLYDRFSRHHPSRENGPVLLLSVWRG